MHRLAAKRHEIRRLFAGMADVSEPLELTVRQVMSARPHSVLPDTSVLDTVKLIKRFEVRHLLVTTESGHLIGMISDRDVVRCFGPERYPDEETLASIQACDIMSEDLITIGPQQPLQKGACLMLEYGVNSLPVVADGMPVGILTMTDLAVTLETMLVYRQKRDDVGTRV